MRRVVVLRDRLAGQSLALPNNVILDTQTVAAMLDDLRVEDGLPFLIEDDGTFSGVWSINEYLRQASLQRGLDLGSMRRVYIYNLARALRFLRRRRAAFQAQDMALDLDQWITEHGEPKTDLTDMARADLVAYSEARAPEVAPTTWNSELGTLTAFFDYAVRAGWITATPVPRWGQRNRSTLTRRVRHVREPKFLKGTQLRLFLATGLRGDGSIDRPAFPERDYAYGLALATMGLRREEAALLLNAEIPTPEQMPSDGIWPFTRIGKGGQPRTVYATAEMVRELDLYRQAERPQIVRAAQPGLRALQRSGQLLLIDSLGPGKGGVPTVRINDHLIPSHRLSDEQRPRLALITRRGDIEPLGLFLGRHGLPPDVKRWNEVFADARDRVDASGHQDRPPAHITVTPHTLRHTYAVRMLSALMREGQRTAQDPYALLSNPVLTVMQLLGHASVETTHRYLYAAERYEEDLPTALRAVAAATASHSTASGAE